MMRSYSSRLSSLIDEFVKSFGLGLEEMVSSGMINLAAVGVRDMEDPIIPGEKRSERHDIR